MPPRSPLAVPIAALALAALLVGCAAHVMQHEARGDAERLASARRQIARRDYVDAEELLKAFVANAGGQAQVDEAIFLLGDCYLQTRQYPLA